MSIIMTGFRKFEKFRFWVSPRKYKIYRISINFHRVSLKNIPFESRSQDGSNEYNHDRVLKIFEFWVSPRKHKIYRISVIFSRISKKNICSESARQAGSDEYNHD